MEEVDVWLPRMDCVVVGPGLGKNQSMLGRYQFKLKNFKMLARLIDCKTANIKHMALYYSFPTCTKIHSKIVKHKICRISLVLQKIVALNIPVIVDGDGLWHIVHQPSTLTGNSIKNLDR